MNIRGLVSMRGLEVIIVVDNTLERRDRLQACQTMNRAQILGLLKIVQLPPRRRSASFH